MARMTEEEKAEWKKQHQADLDGRTRTARKKKAQQEAIERRMARAEEVRLMGDNHVSRIADKDEVAAYYTEVMRDPEAQYSERTAAAQQLQRLQGWEKIQVAEGGNVLTAFLANIHADGDSLTPAWRRTAALNAPDTVDVSSAEVS